MTIKGIPGSMPQTPEWLAMRFYDPERPFRKVVIGASQAAAALNQSKYSSALELYLELRREIPPRETTEEMEIGLAMEPVILSLFAKRYGVRIRAPQPMYHHQIHDFLAATPDALTESAEPEGVDAKCTTYRMFDASGADLHKFGEGADSLPVEYILQGQQQIEVLGVPRIQFPVLLDRTLKVYTVEREPTLIEAIIDAERELVQRVIDARPPEPNWTSPKARELIRVLHGVVADKVVTLSEESVTRWSEIQRLKAEEMRIKAEIEEKKARILWEMGDAQHASFPRGTVQLSRIQVKESTYTATRKAHEQLREKKVK